jgi:hypothetical protein
VVHNNHINRFNNKPGTTHQNREFFRQSLGIDLRKSPEPKGVAPNDKIKENLILMAIDSMSEVIDDRVSVSKALE